MLHRLFGIRDLLLITALLLTTGCASETTPAPEGSKGGDDQLGKVVNGQELSISTDKRIYAPGETVLLTANLRNVGERVVETWGTGTLLDFQLTVVSPDGTELPMTPYGKNLSAMRGSLRESSVRLQPGQQNSVRIALNRLYGVGLAGKYEVFAKRRIIAGYSHRKVEMCEIISNRLEIKIDDTLKVNVDDGLEVWGTAIQPLNETLAELAKRQGLAPDKFLTYRGSDAGGSFPAGVGLYAVTAGREPYVVAVQMMPGVSIPGVSAQQLVLLTPDGKILDQVQCDINSRDGEVVSEFLPKPDADGAQIVMRFLGAEISPGKRNLSNNYYNIIFHGQFWKFGGGSDSKGLCRVGIANDKFTVLFPKLRMPDVKNAKALKR
jgi:hypothetical protein